MRVAHHNPVDYDTHNAKFGSPSHFYQILIFLSIKTVMVALNSVALL